MKARIDRPFHNIRPDERTPIVEECLTASLEFTNVSKDKKIATAVPCKRIAGVYVPPKEGEEAPVLYCTTYAWPNKKWAVHACPFRQVEVVQEKVGMVNPLKASKRAAGN